MIEWRFKPNSPDDMDVDPIQGEFFTTRDIENISTAVVREGIQNALDERNRGAQTSTVKVRIFLSGEKYAVAPEEYSPLIGSLKPHLLAVNSGIATLPDLNSKMRFLVFEDFNTKGLEGDPEEFYVRNKNDNKPHNFYYFWRNVGRSGKSDDKLGRWGLGKTVFPASSKINTFWGLTVRGSDGRKMIMGQSILRIHDVDSPDNPTCGFRPYGMFGEYKSDDYFAVPVEDIPLVQQFESVFQLRRGDQTGLSLIIPFCTEEINIDHLAYSVLEQYFYPILEGRLEVEVADGDTVIPLNIASLSASIDKIDFNKLNQGEGKKVKSKESLTHLFEFAKWVINLKEDDYLHLSPLPISNKPRWGQSLFSDEDKLSKWRDRFENNERVAFKIPLKYHALGGTPKVSWYDAYLEKDASLTRPESLFVRDGITISGITSLDKGFVRGMVIIHDLDLARMLGDSENPAHTEWQPDSRNFKGKYVDGKEAISFVKATLKKLYEKLQRPLEGLQRDLLVDFFSIPAEEEEYVRKEVPNKPKGEDEVEKVEVVEVEGKASPILIQQIHSGLRIYSNPHKDSVAEVVRIKLGYDVPRGDPIRNYSEFDFDVSKQPISIESRGVVITNRLKNYIEFTFKSEEGFEIQLIGFDEKRDLYFKLQ